MLYTLPCGHKIIKYPDKTERELLLEHLVNTQCPICMLEYTQGERKKRKLNQYIENYCVIDVAHHTEQLCQT